MKNFEALLHDFEEILKKYNKVSYNKLQPALAEADIRILLQKVGIDDENVYTLYKWRNGVETSNLSDSMIFQFACSMLSLDEVNYYYKNNLPEHDEDGLVTLFESPYGEVFLFNTNKGGDYGKIHLYSVSLLLIENPRTYYDSLSTMIETTINLYLKSGLIYDEKENFLDEDTAINIEIYEQYNPRCIL